MKHISLVLGIIFLPFLQEVKAQKIIDSLILVENVSVYFDTDSFEITPLYSDSIKKIFGDYQKVQRLKIEAHTDSIGSIEYNIKLSDKRAQSAFRLLESLGISSDSISIVGYGEGQPLVSNRSEEGRSKNRRVDVSFYTVKKFGIISGIVMNDSTRTPLPATVIIRSKEFRDTTYTDSTGLFEIPAPMDEVVVIETNAKDHFFTSKPMKTTICSIKSKQVLKMPRASSGKKFELENFYFVGNKPELLPKSIPVLHRLLEFMKLNPQTCIRIDGHINLPNRAPASKESWHWKLSDDRTKTVFNFLVAKGIDDRRMKRKAFANWEMVYPKATEEKFMKQNRRVEILIIDCKSSVSQ